MVDLSERQTDEGPPTPPEGSGLAQQAYRTARKVVVAVLGVTLLAVGVAMIVLPGPAFVVIPMGLAVLSLEFAWARRWLRRARAYARRATTSARLGPEPRPRPPGRAASGVAS